MIMEISAVMNIQEMAVNKAVMKRAYDQDRQEKANLLADMKTSDQEEKVEKDSSVMKYPAAFANTVQQQDDPQSASIRVERKMDVQASKKDTALQAEGEVVNPKTGRHVDIVV